MDFRQQSFSTIRSVLEHCSYVSNLLQNCPNFFKKVSVGVFGVAKSISKVKTAKKLNISSKLNYLHLNRNRGNFLQVLKLGMCNQWY